jgi:hypothetical protein
LQFKNDAADFLHRRAGNVLYQPTQAYGGVIGRVSLLAR